MDIMEKAKELESKLQALIANASANDAEDLQKLIKDLVLCENAVVELNSMRHKKVLLPQVIKKIEGKLAGLLAGL